MTTTFRILVLTAVAFSGCSGPRTPLTRAAFTGDLPAIERLVARGVPVDEGRSGGLTPLMWAARGGKIEAVRLLVARGADVTATGGVNGWSAVQHALHTGQTAAAIALLEAGAESTGPSGATSLRMAAGYGNADAVRALLARGADPKPPDAAGRTALTEAIGGAWDIDYRWSGCGPHTETVRALLASAPDLTVPDTMWGRSALDKARRERCDEMLALLHGPGVTASRFSP